MKIYLKLLLAGIFVFSLAMGCKKKDKTQKIAPAASGERGTSCQAKNDCASNLSCILGICQPANFDVNATQKECYRVDCSTIDECCGDRETEAPARCRDRDTYCSPTIVGCDTSASACTSDANCIGGGVCGGTRWCQSSFINCTSNTTCNDVCEFPSGMGGAGAIGQCSVSQQACTSDANCFYNGDTCGSGICSCVNQNYDPTHPICTDTECDDVCTLVCDNQRCVEDTSCEGDSDCVAGFRNLCADSGECVECKRDADCDDEANEEDDEDFCDATGTCVTPCRGDSECPMFNACEAGSCVYVGCRTDHECILLGVGSGLEDPRLLSCDIVDKIGTCRVACEIDAHCGSSQVCDGGTCKYIGCSEDSDCKSVLGLHNWERTPETPWTPEGVCQTVPVPAP